MKHAVFGILPLSMAHAFDADPADLLAAAKRGDVEAQSRLFANHKQAIANQVMRMTGDASLVDDIVQEVFIAAFRRLDRFRGDASVQTWLHRIAVNKVRNAWDARRRRTAREQRAAAQGSATSAETPDGQLAADEQLRVFHRALEGLPPKLRDAFVCRVLESMSLEDTAAQLGVPVSTVSYRARRAEAALHAALGLDEAAKGTS